MMKKFIYIYISFFISAFSLCGGRNLYAEESKRDQDEARVREYRDSLLAAAGRIGDDSLRLAYLREQAYVHQYRPYNIIFAQELYEQGKAAGNIRYENEGAYFMASCYDLKHDPDSLSYWVGKLEKMAPLVGTYDYYLEQKAALSRALASRRLIEKAVYVAKETEEEARRRGSNNGLVAACNSLGCAYTVSSRADQALEVLFEARKNFTENTKPFLKADVLSRIAGIYGNKGKDSLKMPYLNEMSAVLEEALAREPRTANNWSNLRIDCQVKYIMHYMNRGDLPAAAAHIEKAGTLLAPHVDPVFWLNMQFMQLQYFNKTKEYDKCIALIDKITPVVLKDYVSTFGALITYKAVTQKNKGDIDGALATYRYLVRMRDSIDNAFSVNQLKQIKEIYHIDNLLLERQKIRNTGYRRVLVMLVLLSFAILIFLTYSRYLSRKIALSEKEAAGAAQRTQAENAAKEKLRRQISYDVRTSLNTVVGFAEILTGAGTKPDRENRAAYNRMIEESARHLMEYVNNILELSRLESGKIRYDSRPADAAELCREALTAAETVEGNCVNASLAEKAGGRTILTDRNYFISLLRSMIVYTYEPAGKTYDTIIIVEWDGAASRLIFSIKNTPLAAGHRADRAHVIRNEINSHFIRHFGGTYRVSYSEKEAGDILFTYPLA